MNERIRELAEQVGAVRNVLAMGRHDGVLFTETELERFAELIVRECAETIQDFVDHRFPASEYPNRLKKYFGVEE
jgi:hypothetical protein